MCLYLRLPHEKYLPPPTFINGKIRAWKVLTVFGNNTQPTSCMGNHTWKPGWNFSNRQTKELDVLEQLGGESFGLAGRRGGVRWGMHVFFNPIHADMWRDHTWHKVVEVECLEEDLVASGLDEITHQPAAVFMKIYLSQEKYDRVTDAKNPLNERLKKDEDVL